MKWGRTGAAFGSVYLKKGLCWVGESDCEIEYALVNYKVVLHNARDHAHDGGCKRAECDR
jgi:hypothetical protein